MLEELISIIISEAIVIAAPTPELGEGPQTEKALVPENHRLH